MTPFLRVAHCSTDVQPMKDHGRDGYAISFFGFKFLDVALHKNCNQHILSAGGKNFLFIKLTNCSYKQNLSPVRGSDKGLATNLANLCLHNINMIDGNLINTF
jgi:hypothetical protein